jgi:hypothetical protein
MAKSGSCLSRLSDIPAFLLVAAFVICGFQPAKRADAPAAAVTSKTYVDSGSGRAKMLRPTRMQVRLSSTRSLDGKKWSEQLGDASLTLASLQLEAPRKPAARWYPAANAGSIPFLLRTHNPRDPPRA